MAVAECPLPPVSGGSASMVQIVERALELVPSDSIAAGRLYAISGELMSSEDPSPDKAEEALRKALSIAQQVGELGLETRSLISSAQVAMYGGRYQAMSELSQRAVSLADRIGDPRSVMLANYWASLSLIILDDPGAARKYAEATLAPAEELRHHSYIARAAFANDVIHRRMGEWETARRFSDHWLATSLVESRLLFSHVLLEHEGGEFP